MNKIKESCLDMKKYKEIVLLLVYTAILQGLLTFTFSVPQGSFMGQLMFSGLLSIKFLSEFLSFLLYIIIIICGLAYAKSSTGTSMLSATLRTFFRTIVPIFIIYFCIDLVKLYFIRQVNLIAYRDTMFLVFHSLYTIIIFAIINRSLNKTLPNIRETAKKLKKKIIVNLFLTILLVALVLVYANLTIQGYTIAIEEPLNLEATNKFLIASVIKVIYNIVLSFSLLLMFSGLLFVNSERKITVPVQSDAQLESKNSIEIDSQNKTEN